MKREAFHQMCSGYRRCHGQMGAVCILPVSSLSCLVGVALVNPWADRSIPPIGANRVLWEPDAHSRIALESLSRAGHSTYYTWPADLKDMGRKREREMAFFRTSHLKIKVKAHISALGSQRIHSNRVQQDLNEIYVGQRNLPASVGCSRLWVPALFLAVTWWTSAPIMFLLPGSASLPAADACTLGPGPTRFLPKILKNKQKLLNCQGA